MPALARTFDAATRTIHVAIVVDNSDKWQLLSGVFNYINTFSLTIFFHENIFEISCDISPGNRSFINRSATPRFRFYLEAFGITNAKLTSGRIQSVGLPEEASAQTRCQEYTRGVVPVNWSGIRDASLPLVKASTGRRQTIVLLPRFLDSSILAIFPTAGNVRRIWLGNAKGLVRDHSYIFSLSRSFSSFCLPRVDATARPHVVVGPDIVFLS